MPISAAVVRAQVLGQRAGVALLLTLAGCADDPAGLRPGLEPQPIMIAAPNAFTMVSGGQHTCAIRTNGLAVCWGPNFAGQTNVSASLGTVTQIAAGRYHTCAIKTGGTLACWGWDGDAALPVPSGLGTVIQVAAGGITCVVKSNQTPACWGNTGFGGTTIPAGLGVVRYVTVGEHHACVMKEDDTVACWGGYYGQSDVPANLGRVRSVEAGGYHTCAVKDDSTLVCWGFSNFGATAVPANLGTVRSVAAGYWMTCARKTDQTVACWGDNDNGETDVPADLGTVSSLGAGYYHTCAIKTDQTMVCWGYNAEGETSVPAGTRYPPSASFSAPDQSASGGTFNLGLSNAVVNTPGGVMSAADAGIQYAFDCGDYAGYSALGSSANATCSAGPAGPQIVKGMVQDEDGDFTEYVDTVDVVSLTPANPTAVVATVNGTLVELTWTDNAVNEIEYRILRSEYVLGAFSAFVQIATLGANTSAYTDNSSTSGSTYRYRVRACNIALCGNGTSNIILVESIPAAPTTITTTVASGTSILVQWDDVSPNENHFALERREYNGTAWNAYVALTNTAADAEAFTDTARVAGVKYQYRVRSCNNAGCSTKVSSPVVKIPTTIPIPPTSLVGNAVSPTSIELSWSDASTNENYFEILRSDLVGGTYSAYTVIGQAAANATTFTDTVAGGSYRYRVRACNLTACSTVAGSPKITTP